MGQYSQPIHSRYLSVLWDSDSTLRTDENDQNSQSIHFNHLSVLYSRKLRSLRKDSYSQPINSNYSKSVLDLGRNNLLKENWYSLSIHSTHISVLDSDSNKYSSPNGPILTTYPFQIFVSSSSDSNTRLTENQCLPAIHFNDLLVLNSSSYALLERINTHRLSISMIN